jgi:hypothetical protein
MDEVWLRFDMVAHTLRKSTFLVEVIELGRQDFLRQQQVGSPRTARRRRARARLWA